MASITCYLLTVFFLLLSSGAIPAKPARVFTIVNQCKYTIWPAIFPGENFDGGGFALKSGESRVFNAPVGWSGRIWGRSGCNFDKTGAGLCETGRCGTTLKCTGSGETPASLAELTLAPAGLDFYDVSLVDGYNLPLSVTPVNGKGNCSVAGCDSDLNQNCPKELSVKSSSGKTVACRSACDVFNTDEYCCRGVHGNSATCKPTSYSKRFKEACPASYSYAYDDATSVLTCNGADYIVAFCSSRKQTVCTYRHNKVVCNGSTSSKSLSRKWMVGMAFYALMILRLVF